MAELFIQLRAVAAAYRPSRRKIMTIGLLMGLVIGLSLGLYVGWVAWPVGYAGEVSVSQALYINMVADLFAFDHNQERVKRAMDWPDAAATACVMMQQTADEGRQLRLWTLLLVLNEGCEG